MDYQKNQPKLNTQKTNLNEIPKANIVDTHLGT